MTEVLMPILGEMTNIRLESGVSAFTKEPFVRIQVEGRSPVGQVIRIVGQADVGQCRIQSAMWAEMAAVSALDAATFAWAQAQGMDDEEAATMVQSIRHHRLDNDDDEEDPS